MARGAPPGEQTLLAFPKTHPQGEEVQEALARARTAENLVDLYDAWLRLRVARAAAAAERAREAERLDVRAEHVLRSVEAARRVSLAPEAPRSKGGKGRKGPPAKDDPLAEFQRSAEQELKAARRALAERAKAEEAALDRELDGIKRALRTRAEVILEGYRPRLEVQVQPVGRDRALVHAARPTEDDAVLLSWVLAKRLFTRYDAFFDDAVDDLSLPPPRFYSDEGNAEVRFASADDEDRFLASLTADFWPVKGMLPFSVPGHDFPRFRLVNQGPLAEVEARLPGQPYSHLMPKEAAELLSGYLIRLKVSGALDLVLRVA